MSHDVYTLDFQRNNIKMFRVFKTVSEFDYSSQTFIQEIPVSSAKQQQFDAVVQSRNEISELFEYHKDIPESLSGSAWDIANNGYKTNSIAQYYRDNMTIREKVANYTALIAAMASGIISNSITFHVEVHFNDGSVALLKLDGVDSNGDLTFSFLKGIDADGNPIREDKSSYTSGSYSFAIQGQSGAERFVEAARRAGVPISSGSSGGFKTECKFDQGKVVSCHLVQQ